MAYRKTTEGAGHVAQVARKLAKNLSANRTAEFATEAARARASDTVYEKVFTLVSHARTAFETASTLGEEDDDPEIGARPLPERGAKTALVREMGALVRELKQWSEVEAGDGCSGGTDGGGSGGEGGGGAPLRLTLADGWETAIDQESGRAYYYHAESLAVQWNRPQPVRGSALLPPPPPPRLPQQEQQQQPSPLLELRDNEELIDVVV